MVHVDVEEERKEILKRYRKLLKQAKPVLKPGDTKLIKKAFNISLDAHKDMRRKSGEPYIYHPLEVALVCVEEIGLGTTSIIAALLHDVVEDTDMTLKDIEREFGPKVAQIIDGLTKIGGSFEQGTSAQAENFRKMLSKMEEGDWLYNYRYEENIGYSMRNVLNKAKYLNTDIPVHNAFLKNKSFLRECYIDFFPDLLQHAKGINALLQMEN